MQEGEHLSISQQHKQLGDQPHLSLPAYGRTGQGHSPSQQHHSNTRKPEQPSTQNHPDEEYDEGAFDQELIDFTDSCRPSNASIRADAATKPNPRLSEITPRGSSMYEVKQAPLITEDSEAVAAQIMNMQDHQNNDDREDSGNQAHCSFQSIVNFRKTVGVRRSIVQEDTPGHFPRAQDDGNSSLNQQPLSNDTNSIVDIRPLQNLFGNIKGGAGDDVESSIRLRGSEVINNIQESSFRSNSNIFEDCVSLGNQVMQVPTTTTTYGQVDKGGQNQQPPQSQVVHQKLIIDPKILFENLEDSDKKKYPHIQDDRRASETTEGGPKRVTNVKDLLKLFNVDISEESTFELNGQTYFVDLQEETEKNFNIPLHTMSAFFAPQEPNSSGNEHKKEAPYNQAFRATFGNLIEQMQKGANQPSKLPAFQSSLYQGGSQEAAFAQFALGGGGGAETHAKQFGLPNLDKLLLSNDPSPTSVANKFQNSYYFPNFAPSFSRAISEREVLKLDKEIQVEIISSSEGFSHIAGATDINTPLYIDRGLSQYSGFTTGNGGGFGFLPGLNGKSISSNTNVMAGVSPSVQFTGAATTVDPSVSQVSPINDNNVVQNSIANNGEQSSTAVTLAVPDSDYYAELQRKLALEIAAEEDALLEAAMNPKKKGKKKTGGQSAKTISVIENNSMKLQQPDNVPPPPPGQTHVHHALKQSVTPPPPLSQSHSSFQSLERNDGSISARPDFGKNGIKASVKETTPTMLSAHFELGELSNFNMMQPAGLRRVLSVRDAGPMVSKQQSLQSDLQMKAMLSQMQSHNAKLQEEIEKIKKEAQEKYIGGITRSLAQAELHIVFLFSSPLAIRRDKPIGSDFKDNFKQQALLEFKKEFKEIKHSLKETNQHIKLKSMRATIENLSMILAQSPLALHFSGHGFETKGPGGKVQNSLLLEYEDGEGEEVSEQQLTKIIQASNADLEFVFVASCYSEFAGKAFLKAGARHVICVKSGNQIADVAVILFSKTFYLSAFSQNMTICGSFEMAKSLVCNRYGPGEAAKFSILTRQETFGESTTPRPAKKRKKKKMFALMPEIDDDEEFKVEHLPPQHTCKVFGPFERGSVEQMDVEPRFHEVPSPVDQFQGRQLELFEVVHNVLNHRLVTIIGLPGIGKTALAKNSVNYMADRRMFKLGIVFFSLKGYKNADVFLKKLVSNLVVSHFDLEPEERGHINEGNVDRLFRMIVAYFRAAEEDQMLVVFDNAEELLYHDRKGFRDMITELLSQCPCLRFLITSRVTVGVLQDVQEKIIVLQELSPAHSVDLFLSRARHIDDHEKLELINYRPESVMLVGDVTQADQQVTNLSKHHLFKILAGNPHAIILAAPLLLNKRLIELYQLLNSERLLEVLKVDGVTDSTVASLCLSLEASICVLQNEDHLTLNFFFLIGLLPGGIFKEELSMIWKPLTKDSIKDPGCEYHVEKLMRLSLLQVKEQAGDQKDEAKLMLPPFINTYAEQTIDPQLKARFQEQLCEFYVQKLKDLYRQDYRQWAQTKQSGSNSGSTTTLGQGDASPVDNGQSNNNDATPRRQQMEQEFISECRLKLIRHETNIWACIYRMAKSDQPISVEQLEIEPLHPTKLQRKRSRRFSEMTPKSRMTNSLRVLQQPSKFGGSKRERKQSNDTSNEEAAGLQNAFGDFSQLDDNLANTLGREESGSGSIEDNGLKRQPTQHSQSEKTQREMIKQRYSEVKALVSQQHFKNYGVPPSQVIEEDIGDNKSDISDNTGRPSMKRQSDCTSQLKMLQEPDFFSHLLPQADGNDGDDNDGGSSHSSAFLEDEEDKEAQPLKLRLQMSHANSDNDALPFKPSDTVLFKNSSTKVDASLPSASATEAAQPQDSSEAQKESEKANLGFTSQATVSKERAAMLIQESIKNMMAEKINEIVRHSIVKFHRPSLRISMMEGDECLTGKALNEQQPAAVESDDDMYLPQKCFSQQNMIGSFKLGPCASSPDSQYRGVSHLSESEKLIVYYAMNLYLLADYDSALRIILKYAKEIKGGSLLFEANLERVLGLIYLRKVEIKEAMTAFKKAEQLYEQCRCYYGSALTKFSIGFMYRSNFSELLTTNDLPSKGKHDLILAAQRNLNAALRLFQQLNHIVGQARCHEHLSVIQSKLGQTSKAREHQKESMLLNSQFDRYQYKYKKRCPHIPRSAGQDISLMSEIVNDNETRNLYPDLSTSFTGGGGGQHTPTGRSQFYQEKRDSQIISKFNEDEQPLKTKLSLSHQVSAPPLNMQDISGSETITLNYNASVNNNVTPSPGSDASGLNALLLDTTSKLAVLNFADRTQDPALSTGRDDPYFGGSEIGGDREEFKYNGESPPPTGKIPELAISKSQIVEEIPILNLIPIHSVNSGGIKHNSNITLEVVEEEEPAQEGANDSSQTMVPLTHANSVQQNGSQDMLSVPILAPLTKSSSEQQHLTNTTQASPLAPHQINEMDAPEERDSPQITYPLTIQPPSLESNQPVASPILKSAPAKIMPQAKIHRLGAAAMNHRNLSIQTAAASLHQISPSGNTTAKNFDSQRGLENLEVASASQTPRSLAGSRTPIVIKRNQLKEFQHPTPRGDGPGGLQVNSSLISGGATGGTVSTSTNVSQPANIIKLSKKQHMFVRINKSIDLTGFGGLKGLSAHSVAEPNTPPPPLEEAKSPINKIVQHGYKLGASLLEKLHHSREIIANIGQMHGVKVHRKDTDHSQNQNINVANNQQDNNNKDSE